MKITVLSKESGATEAEYESNQVPRIGDSMSFTGDDSHVVDDVVWLPPSPREAEQVLIYVRPS